MIKKCVFPAAGYGTRFLPATKSMPKEMLPIMCKPLIEYAAEEALDAGIKDMCIVTGRGKRAIEDYFDINYELEKKINGTNKEINLVSTRRLIENCTFSYIRQIRMNGLGDAILTAKPIVGQEPFSVILADDLCVSKNKDNITKKMLELYDKYNCSIIAIMQVSDEQIHNYGVVSGKNISDEILEVDNLVEKPDIKNKPSNWAIIGRYILTPCIFNHIQNISQGINGEIQITDAIKMQLATKKVMAYKFSGIRFDCGSIQGFIEATNYFYKKNIKQQILVNKKDMAYTD